MMTSNTVTVFVFTIWKNHRKVGGSLIAPEARAVSIWSRNHQRTIAHQSVSAAGWKALEAEFRDTLPSILPKESAVVRMLDPNGAALEVRHLVSMPVEVPVVGPMAVLDQVFTAQMAQARQPAEPTAVRQ